MQFPSPPPRWSVRRRWLPWRLRLRRMNYLPILDPIDTPRKVWLDTLDTLLLELISTAKMLVNAVLYLVALVVLTAEAFAAMVALPFVTMSRLLRMRPFTVAARCRRLKVVYLAEAVGWRGSRSLMRTLVEEIEAHGHPLSARKLEADAVRAGE